MARQARCPHAYRHDPQDDTLRCREMGYPNDCCAHVKFCRMTMHWENSEYWDKCPLLKYHKNLEGERNDGKQV